MQSFNILAIACALFVYAADALPANMTETQTTTPRPGVCTERPEGWLVEIGCWGYIQCVEGVETSFLCEPGLNYDRTLQKCVAPGEGTSACGLETLCEGRKNGNHPDVNHSCGSFFACHNEIFYGRQYCPANLVFDFDMQLCVFSFQVGPPCTPTPFF